MKQRNDMNEKLLRQFRGEETKEEEEEDKGGISVDRLEHLLAKVNLEPEDASSAYDDLNEEEKKDFQAFIQQKEVQNAVQIWQPWWQHRKEFATAAIQEIDDTDAIEYNMNRFGQEKFLDDDIIEPEEEEKHDD